VFAHSTANFVFDFATVTQITASFAEEVVGKLLVSLGPKRFQSRIILDGLDDGLVRGQIARALTQRRDEADAAERRRRSDRRSRGKADRRRADR
jgi:hypothetical protein